MQGRDVVCGIRDHGIKGSGSLAMGSINLKSENNFEGMHGKGRLKNAHLNLLYINKYYSYYGSKYRNFGIRFAAACLSCHERDNGKTLLYLGIQ